MSIQNQFEELRINYPGLSLRKDDKSFFIEGMLDFIATYNEVPIEDTFDIMIIVPEEYPYQLPKIFETGYRIPEDYHKLVDGSLCLSTMLGIRIKLAADSSLKAYVEKLVIPYLYSFRYKQIYGEMPYGELSHNRGITEFYCELFKTDSADVAIGLLKILAGRYRGHQLCPCGTGMKLRDCHGNFIREVQIYQDKNDYELDLISCCRECYRETFLGETRNHHQN